MTSPPGYWPAGPRFVARVDPAMHGDVGIVPTYTLTYYDAATLARFLDPILRVMTTKDAPQHAATLETIRGRARWWIDHDRVDPPTERPG